MKKTRRNLRKPKRSKKRVSHKVKYGKRSRALKMRKNRRHGRNSRKLRGGGSFVPQDLENTGRSIQDYFYKMYQNFTGGQNDWSYSSSVDQPNLLKSNQPTSKMSNLQQLNESADLKVNNMLK